MQRHGHNLLKFLDEDRSRQRFCDVSVSVGGTLYNAHKVVLAHGSSYFHAELSKNPATAHVTLDHVEDSIFQHLLGLLYTSECAVAERELPALLEAARFLDMMDILKLLCEEEYNHPVQVTEAQNEMRMSPEVEVTPSDSPADVTDTKSPPSQHLSTENSLQDNLEESQTHIAQAIPHEAEGTTGQKIAITRRSARRRRAPTKYQKDRVKDTPEEKQKAESSKDQDEERNIDMGEMVVEDHVPKVDMPKTITRDVVDEGEGEEEGDMSEDVVLHRKTDETFLGDKIPGQQGSVTLRAESQAAQEVGVRVSTPGGSNQGPVYPEGLAPVIIQTSSKKTLKCPKCDKTFDRAGETHKEKSMAAFVNELINCYSFYSSFQYQDETIIDLVYLLFISQ